MVRTAQHYQSQIQAYKDQLATATGIRNIAAFTNELSNLQSELTNIYKQGNSYISDFTSNPEGALSSQAKNLFSKYGAFDMCNMKGYGCTTGVSAYDRSATIRALVTGNIKPSELARPGHIFPLYGHENGVLGRDGHTEALLDLTRMAGLTPGGALIEILNQDGTMARLPQLLEIAEKFQLKIIAIKDIQEYRRNNKI